MVMHIIVKNLVLKLAERTNGGALPGKQNMTGSTPVKTIFLISHTFLIDTGNVQP